MLELCFNWFRIKVNKLKKKPLELYNKHSKQTLEMICFHVSVVYSGEHDFCICAKC
jgi:hypothetical protein